MARSTPAIALRGFSAGYGERVVLRSISCAIPRDCTTAVVGPGGSGKSTLLRAIHLPSQRLREDDCSAIARRRAVQRDVHAFVAEETAVRAQEIWQSGGLWRTSGQMSYLPQKPLPESQSLASLLGHRRPGTSVGFRDARRYLYRFWRVAIPAAEALDAAFDTPLCRLPQTLRRLAEFTVAASSPAPLLLVDEPDRGAGERESGWIAAKLCALGGQRTIVVITHNLGLARQVSDTMIFLLDGLIVEAGDTALMFARPRHPRTRALITYGS